MFFSHRCELLDAAGEWCVGREDGALYLATRGPQRGAGSGAASPPPAAVVVPAVDELLRVEGTQRRPVGGVCYCLSGQPGALRAVVRSMPFSFPVPAFFCRLQFTVSAVRAWGP